MRRVRSGARRRRCSSSIHRATWSRRGAAPARDTNGPTSSTASTSTDDNVWLGGGGEKDAQILKFTRQGKFLHADRPQGQEHRQQRHAESRRRRQPDARSRRQRALRRRRLRQSSRHRLRRRDRRVQTPLGRVRQDGRTTAISRRQASACRAPSAARCSTKTSRATTIPTARRRRSSASSTPCASRATAWCTSAIAPTIACRCFARTARSSRKRSWRRRRSAADRCGTSRSRPIRRRPI